MIKKEATAMKKISAFILTGLLACCLLLASCSPAPATLCSCEAPEDRIYALATALYTLPDSYHLDKANQEALWGLGEGKDGALDINTEALRAWEAHNRTRFHQADFAPGLLEELTTLSDTFGNKMLIALGILGPRYSRYGINPSFPVGLERMVAGYGASLTCTSVVSSLQEDGSWQFTAPVTVTEEDGTETTFTITGAALFDADGKFTSIEITNDGGLSAFIEDHITWPGPDERTLPSYPPGQTPGPPTP